jgi:pyruvate/2-oxoglutarate/acetoin dehydrogenase E1 component
MTYRDAVREAIRTALRAGDRVFLMGEDVGRLRSEQGTTRRIWTPTD